MVDRQMKEAQYDYQTNANLVVHRDNQGPRDNGPTGEPDSLAGKPIHKFGDRAVRERPQDRKIKQPDKPTKPAAGKPSNNNVLNRKKTTKLVSGTQMNVLDLESEQLVYRPKTKETQMIYEDFLTMMLHYLPDQSQTTLKGALDVILAILKTDDVKDTQKMQDIEAVIGKITPEEFNKMYQLSRCLVDYTEEINEKDHYAGENIIEVPVEFDVEEVEEEESEVEEGKSEEEEIQETEEEAIQGLGSSLGPSTFTKGKSKQQQTLEEVFNNPYWLQNCIREILKVDDTFVLNYERDILNILSLKDKRECENKLVLLLKQENFSFIKTLLENRFTIFYLTRLGKSQNEKERNEILDEMNESQEGRAVIEKIEEIKSGLSAAPEKEDLIHEVGKKLKHTLHDEKMTDSLMNKIVRNNLNLESLQFTQGAHFMANKVVMLPKGVERIKKKGYEEVFIPASENLKIKEEKEVPIKSLPEWMHVAFMGRDLDGNYSFITEKFNRVQSKVMNSALNNDHNMLICAPTSSGKTNIALMTILRLISHYRDQTTGEINLKNFKVVYIAPMKALVKETVGNFTQRLKEFGIQVRELSGDINLTKKEIENTHVIVSTPEKWDIITRKTGEKTFTELVKLIILDEIHLLHDTRGAVLESIVSRTIRKIEASGEKVRMVALSATLPNYEDVAAFLRVEKDKGLFHFDSSYRPVPLEQLYIGITEKKSIKRMLLMNELAYEKVIERAGKKQIIIFVHSRRETVRTAKAIKEMALQRDELNKFLATENKAAEFRAILSEDLPNIRDPGLKDLLEYGIGVHHAGMNREDREIVEDYFNNGYLQLIVSTATLAWGVNLPAHTVIIKGTQVYDPEKGGWAELSFLDVLQMMGRAGRFGYGSPKGEGIIITSHHELQFYLSLLNQQLPIESQMIASLADTLNAEIVLGTITNLKDAVNWLTYTYLYIRMLKNPTLYGISTEESQKDQFLLQRRSDLIHSSANLLDKNGLIKYDRKTGFFQMTQLGRIASHYYIKHPSMAIYNENLKPNINIIDLFRLFSLSNEFKLIPIREEEKKEVERLMVKVPVPIKGAFDEPATKINILLQTYISEFKLDGYAIASDMVYIAQSAGRIFRALFEICVKRGWANLALVCLNVCKMIDKRMWSTMTPLRQFKVIPEEIMYKIERKEQLTWDRFYDLSATQISELIKINKKQGEGVYKLVHTFPRLELMANIQPLTRSSILVELIITPDFKWNNSYHGTAETFHVFVEDNDSEIILHYEVFILKARNAEEDHHLTFIVPMIEPVPPQYFIRVVSDRWINCEKLLAISFKHTILPEKFPPNTKLLDLQPLLFNVLKYPEAERMYKEEYKFDQMLPIQTQTFKTLYDTNESILVGAPTGSGKTLCSDFAILKYLRELSTSQSRNRAPIIYVASIEALVKDKLKEFSAKFGDALGFKVDMLTGQLSLDNRIFDNCHIVLSTPDKLDMLTRRWRKKQNVQEISLVIVDEVHLLGEAGGVLEVVLSRLRYMSNQVERDMRIVTLGTSLANPYSLADWLGIKHSNVFNFNPNVRPNKLEIYIQGYDHSSRKMRLLAMSKPLYTALKTHTGGSVRGKERERVNLSCMVYVSDRKHARLTALDLLTHAAIDDAPQRFLMTQGNISAEYEDLLEEIDEPTLKHTLRYGVGYLHESLSEREKEVILHLYQSRIIQVLIVTHSLCWEINHFCHLVVLLDPVKYDGKERSWIDYSIPDVLQIMGRASLSPLSSHSSTASTCKFLLFCQSSKKDFYKKFLSESFPLESHLNHFLHDHINAEVVADTIQNKQDCLDWLTWTYMYRRLLQNPNYYDLKGKTNLHLNDYLSELVENTILDLTKASCITVNERTQEIMPLNYGRVAVFYYVKYNTIDLFAQSLNEESRKMKDMIDILKSSYEFEEIAIRKGDEEMLRDLSDEIVYKIAPREDLHFNEPHLKTFILLQCYFARKPIPSDLVTDQKQIVELAQRLVLAMVDVLSTRGLLKHALLAMELCQMIIQAMWISQSPLLQLPHFDSELVKKCSDKGVEDISDLMNMEDDDRKKLLRMSNSEIMDVARVCNRYPAIEMNVSTSSESFEPKENFEVTITLSRDYDSSFLTPVPSLFYPSEKEEAWWLIVGESSNNTLHSIKRFTFVKDFKLTFKLAAPENEGKFAYNVFLLSDSWVGCDQEEKFEFKVMSS